jgi:hypothetical protein
VITRFFQSAVAVGHPDSSGNGRKPEASSNQKNHSSDNKITAAAFSLKTGSSKGRVNCEELSNLGIARALRNVDIHRGRSGNSKIQPGISNSSEKPENQDPDLFGKPEAIPQFIKYKSMIDNTYTSDMLSSGKPENRKTGNCAKKIARESSLF